jgi:cag pathogenicity island protein 24
MKFTRLSKEQFEELHQEFINFLATQSITAEEWKDIKTNKPEVAEQELDVFSDLVWEGVLTKAEYLENISPQHMYLFYLGESEIELIGLKLNSKDVDLTTSEGFGWLRENLMSDDVEIFNAKKAYSNDKQLDKFALIQQGSVITKGELFTYFDKLIN